MVTSHKRGVSTSAEAGPPPKHHQTDANDAPDDILALITLSDLKSCFKGLLADPTAGPVAQKHLDTYAEKALAAERARLKQEAADLKALSQKWTSKIFDRGFGTKMRGMTSIGAWGGATSQFLPAAFRIWMAGPKVGGPHIAFDLLVHLANRTVAPGDGSECMVEGSGKENIWVYEGIEAMLVRIALELCEAHSEGPVAWTSTSNACLWEERIEELNQRLQYPSFEEYQFKQIAGLLRDGKVQGELLPLTTSSLGPDLASLQTRFDDKYDDEFSHGW